jgi:hypothetical protein
VTPLEEYAEAAAKVGERDDCFATVADFAEHHKEADRFAVPWIDRAVG